MMAFLFEREHDRLDGGTVPREWVVVSRTRPRDLLEAEWDWADSWNRYLADRTRPAARVRRELPVVMDNHRPADYDGLDAGL